MENTNSINNQMAMLGVSSTDSSEGDEFDEARKQFKQDDIELEAERKAAEKKKAIEDAAQYEVETAEMRQTKDPRVTQARRLGILKDSGTTLKQLEALKKEIPTEPFFPYIYGEGKQALGEAAGVIGGTYRGTREFTLEIPSIIGTVSNATDYIQDWGIWAGKTAAKWIQHGPNKNRNVKHGLSNITPPLRRVMMPDDISYPIPFSLRSNPADDIAQLAFKTHYKKISGEAYIKDLEAQFRTSALERERGWLDRSIYFTSGFAGELVLGGPLGGKAFKTAAMSAPKQRIVDKLYLDVQEGRMKLGDVTQERGIQAAVRKMVMGDTVNMPDHILKWRDQAYTILKGSGLHTKEALNYAGGAGLATTVAYGTLHMATGDEQYAEAVAPLYGLIGMFTGMKPYTKGAKRIFIHPISKIGFSYQNQAYTVGELLRTPFKFMHLTKAHKYKELDNETLANEHMLRYAGATKDQAKLLSGDSEATKTFLKDKVTKQAIEDAVTFSEMLTNLAAKHPEYYDYIRKASERTKVVESRFKDVFVDDPIKKERMKQVFINDLKRENKRSRAYSEEELNDIINAYEPADMEFLADQIFMIDFLSSIRNMAVNEATISSLAPTKAIDLFTESFMYNETLQKQVTVMKSALKALRSTDNISESTTKFLDNIDNTYKGLEEDAVLSSTKLKRLMQDKVEEQKTINDVKYISSLEDMGKINRFKGMNENQIVEAEEQMFTDMQTAVINRRKETIEDFSNEYEKLYYDIDIPPNTRAEEIRRLRANARPIEIDASNLISELNKSLVQEASAATLGRIGVTPQRGILESGFDSLKTTLYESGIKVKYNTEDLISLDLSYLQNSVAPLIHNKIKQLHADIKQTNPQYFINNKNTKDFNIRGEGNSEIEKVFTKIRDDGYAEGADDIVKRDLAQAIRTDALTVARMPVSGTINPDEFINKLNEFAAPRITVENAHTVAKDLFNRARNLDPTKQSPKISDLNEIGYKFINEIDDGLQKATVNSEGISKSIKNVSTRYREEVTDVYYSGPGSAVFKHKKAIRNQEDPRPLKNAFNRFFLNQEPSLSRKQFDKIFPKTKEGASAEELKILSERREQAEDALRYALSDHLLNGNNSLSKIAGGNFKQFANQFKDILGKENMGNLVNYHKHIKDFHKKVREVEINNSQQQFNEAFKNLNDRQKQQLKETVYGQTKGQELNPEDIWEFIIGGKVGRRPLREVTDVDVDIEQQIKGATKNVGLEQGKVDTLLTKSRLPVNEGPWGNKPIRDDRIAIILENAPELKEPLKDIVINKIIDASFYSTDFRRFDRRFGTVTLNEEIDITAFSNIFKKNADNLRSLFSDDELSVLQDLFEGSVITSAGTKMTKILNLASTPTTQSRASRLFALQRKVVGMPYLATEQAVMAFQREKAAYLKRIVLDTEFAALLKTMVVDGNITRNNVLKYMQFLKATYGEASIEDAGGGEDSSDYNFLYEQLQEEHNHYNNANTQYGVTNLNVTAEQIGDKGSEIKDSIEKNIGIKVLMPILAPLKGLFYWESTEIFDENQKKALADAAKKSRIEDEKRFRAERRRETKTKLLGLDSID